MKARGHGRRPAPVRVGAGMREGLEAVAGPLVGRGDRAAGAGIGADAAVVGYGRTRWFLHDGGEHGRHERARAEAPAPAATDDFDELDRRGGGRTMTAG